MKKAINKALIFALSFALVQSVMPLRVIAEDEVPETETSEQTEEIVEEEQNEEIVEEEQTEEIVEEEQQEEIIEEEQTEEIVEEEDSPVIVEEVIEEEDLVEAVVPADNTIQTSNTKETAIEIKMGEWKKIETDSFSDLIWFKFTPTESGNYYLESYWEIPDPLDLNTYVEMYDNNNQLIGIDDNTGADKNFCISRYLDAGKTYYYKTKLKSGSEKFIQVRLKRDNMLTIVPVGKVEITVPYGGSTKLQYKALAEDTTNLKSEWYSYQYDISGNSTTSVTISNITESGYATAVLTDRFGNSVIQTFRIIVDNGFKAYFKYPVQHTVSPLNGNYQLTPIVEANDKTGIKYTWYIWPWNGSDWEESYISAGSESTLTFKVPDQKTKYVCRVEDKYGTVIWAEAIYITYAIDEVIFYSDRYIVPRGGSTNLYMQVSDNVNWSIEDTDIATVSSSGIVYGNKVGVTKVTATSKNNASKKATAELIVPFDDVKDESSYYFDPVYWAVDREITTGTSPTAFKPNDACTREQFVTFLWRYAGKPKPETTNSFTDMKEGAYYVDAVTWAYEKGITTGLNDGTGRFGVGQPCTREQCVTFLYRFIKSIVDSANGHALDDYTNIYRYQMFTDTQKGKYYFDAVMWAYDKGITTGLNNGTGKFGVGSKCSRAMIVTFLYRFYIYNLETIIGLFS